MDAECGDRKPWPWGALHGRGHKDRSTAQSSGHLKTRQPFLELPAPASGWGGREGADVVRASVAGGLSPSCRQHDAVAGSTDLETDCGCC